jgi:hypothetical protein
MKYSHTVSICLSLVLAFCFGDSLRANVVDACMRLLHLSKLVAQQTPRVNDIYGTVLLLQYALCLSDPMINGLPYLVALFFAMMAEPYLHFVGCFALVVFFTIFCQVWCLMALSSSCNVRLLVIILSSRPNQIKLAMSLVPMAWRAFFYWAVWRFLPSEQTQPMVELVA